ncbi:MAG: DUF1499 domain-containing protein [Microcoleaceae cyanobacterium]
MKTTYKRQNPMKKSFPQSLLSLLLVLVITIASTTISFVGLIQPVFAQPYSPTFMAALFSFSGSRPDNLGVENGHLQPCPESPNCVSSQSLDEEHQIDPLNYQATPEETFDRLKMVIETMNNAEIITENNSYLYAEFTTPILGFVDDVEFYLDSDQNLIQVRSASRLGESDLGVNRRRIETIRAMFES